MSGIETGLESILWRSRTLLLCYIVFIEVNLQICSTECVVESNSSVNMHLKCVDL